MPNILFTYKRNKQPTLTVDTGAKNISWSYNLNTQSFATYGGEVVQVLSVNVDNITIEGEVKNYGQMENIYNWFLFYIQDATQGFQNEPGYNEETVTMQYPERGWTLEIKPINLPAMRYGRDIVVPTWQIQAHVIEPDQNMKELAITNSLSKQANSDLSAFGNLTADVGFELANPFSDPLGRASPEDAKIFGQPEDANQALEGISGKLSDIINSYTQQDFKDAIQNMGLDYTSGPTTHSSQSKSQDSKTPSKPAKSKPSASTPTPKK